MAAKTDVFCVSNCATDKTVCNKTMIHQTQTCFIKQLHQATLTIYTEKTPCKF